MEEKNQNRNQNPEQQQTPHKRRVRYKGTHPRRFEEKYKELNPEKYADTIEHVIQKGGTPAGMHISIMVKEILDFLQIRPGQKGLDATLGYGGHTRAMLEQLQGEGHIYGLDVDPIESVKTKKRLEEKGFGLDILTVKLENFANIDKVAEEAGKFDFVLADLGVSSMQIDNPDRGFTFKAEGPLDLRMNPEKGISAAERLRDISKEELTGMLIENSDEPYAEEIAEALKNVKYLAIMDRTEDYNGHCGPLGAEIKSALYNADLHPATLNYCYGIGGRDVTVESLASVFEDLKTVEETGLLGETYRYLSVRE